MTAIIVIYGPDLKLAALQIFYYPATAPCPPFLASIFIPLFMFPRKSFSSVSSNFYRTSQSHASVSIVRNTRISFQIRQKSSVYFYIFPAENNLQVLCIFTVPSTIPSLKGKITTQKTS